MAKESLLSSPKHEPSSAIPDSYFAFTAFCECDTFFYIGTNHGIFRKNKVTGSLLFLTQQNSNLPNNHVTSIACTRDGNAYIGTTNGIARWHNSVLLLTSTEDSNIPDHHITALAVDKEDTIWIGTASAGLAKSFGDKKRMLITYPIHTYDKNIHSITVDPLGYVWVAFQQGGIEYFPGDNLPTGSSPPSVEEQLSIDAATFLLHTNKQGTFLTNGNACQPISIEPSCHKIICSYYTTTYSRMILCNRDGVHVFTISDPFSGYRTMRYSEFIKSISYRCPDQNSTKIVEWIRGFETE